MGKQVELQSVKFIRSYINLQGKIIENKKASNLKTRITNALDQGKLTKRDPYWNEIDEIISQLASFIQKNPNHGILKIETRTLNGLEEIAGCDCDINSLEGIARVPDDVIMCSTDVLNLEFQNLAFTGKWREFIGNPSKHFTAMIFGKPKFGKSILAIDFANYLAQNHGTVLYIAKEEGIDEELKQKLMRMSHPDFMVVGSIPNEEELERFDFIFFDSVNKLRLTPEYLDQLKDRYPEKSFISIFQTTKLGNFRGSNEFQHDVDIVIEVPEKGLAVQNGRYNQGGTIKVFEENN